ncbi:MAG: amidohydrolase family protein [Candidatus Hydrogenedentes bacterium]|nr:amidohydrolase family protein [Candidatus Hydrogenedentota bacterium]
MWRQTTKFEQNQRIFSEEFDAFLPKRILDFHVHVFNRGVAPPKTPYSCGGHYIVHYDFDDLSHDLDAAYPGRETSAVCFGMPIVGYDTALNNHYIGEASDNKRFFGLRLLDLENDSPDALRQDLESGKFAGVKPYPDYVRKPDVNAVEIHEMLPDWVMQPVNDLGLLVMLHIPRKARLADPLNQQQLVELCTRYPRAQIVLAHIGRAYYLKNVIGNLDSLKNLPNLYYDLAMVNHWEVMEHLFATVDAKKILYASDIPIALAPGKSVEINNQYTYVTPVPWALSISDEHKKLQFTGFLYEELRAIKKAVERLDTPRAFVEDLFYNNGMALLQRVLSRK